MAGKLLAEGEQREENVSLSKVVLKKLVDKKEAGCVFQYGNKVVSDYFVIFFMRHASTNPSYAIYIKKKYGPAVARNRAKRIVRAALQHIKDMIGAYTIILIPRKHLKKLGFFQVVDELQRIFSVADL